MNPDYELIAARHHVLAPGATEMIFVTIPGAPWSKSRPRFGTKRGYSDPKDRAAEQRTAAVLRRVVPEPFTGNVALTCVFFRPNRQRIDADNLLKHVCDSANGILWLDDSQATSVSGVVELDPENPRTILIASDHTSSLTRGSDWWAPCATCGGRIQLAGNTGHISKYCSPTCAKARHGGIDLSVPVACAGCGQPFVRDTSSRKYCSTGCVIRKGVPRPDRRKPAATCTDCGTALSKPGYVRCRACWTTARSNATA